eukprot:38678-Amphidinium_carterae.2
MGAIGAAPWGQSGNYQKYMQSAVEYTENFNATDQLYGILYPWLAWLSAQGELAPSWHTEADKRDHWIDYEAFALFGSRGQKAKRSRWFQANQRWREIRGMGGHILLSIMYLGTSSDWWADLSSSPWRLHHHTASEVSRGVRDVNRNAVSDMRAPQPLFSASNSPTGSPKGCTVRTVVTCLSVCCVSRVSARFGTGAAARTNRCTVRHIKIPAKPRQRKIQLQDSHRDMFRWSTVLRLFGADPVVKRYTLVYRRVSCFFHRPTKCIQLFLFRVVHVQVALCSSVLHRQVSTGKYRFSRVAGLLKQRGRASPDNEPGEEPERAVGPSNAEVDRRASKGLHAAAEILCSSSSVALFNTIVELSDPLERTFWSTVQAFETSRGTLDWHIGMSSLQRVWHGEVLQMLLSPEFCVHVGLSSAVASAEPPLSGDLSDEVVMAAYTYTLSLIGTDAIWQEGYYSTPPAMFCGLLSGDADARDCARYRIRDLWQATLDLESRCASDMALTGIMSSLVWRRASWVRDLFISFEECEYVQLPTDTHTEVTCAYMRGGTKIIEDLFGVLKRESNLSLNGRLDALSAYDTVSTCRRLSEDDLVAIESEPSDDVSVSILGPSMFNPARNEFSLDSTDGIWSELFEGKAYAHPSPEGFMEQSMATSALLEMVEHPATTFAMSKLPPVGWLVKHESAGWGDALLVAATTSSGLVGLCVRYHTIGSGQYVQPLSETPTVHVGTCYAHRRWRLLHLSSVEGWCCYHLKPTLSAENGLSALPRDRIRLELNPHPWTLVAAAALTGWQGITVSEMQLFARHLSWKDMGRTEAEVVRSMTRKALDSFPDSGPEVRWLVAQRLGENGPTHRVKTTITPEAEHELTEAIAADELADMLGAVRHRRHSAPRSEAHRVDRDPQFHAGPPLQQQQQRSSTGAASSTSAAPAHQPAALIQPRPRNGSAFTLEDAKDLLPVAKGCGVAIHSGKAWQVKYTGRVTDGPKSKMGTYSGREGLTFNKALKVCLEWAWARHAEAEPSAACPIDWASFPE